MICILLEFQSARLRDAPRTGSYAGSYAGSFAGSCKDSGRL